VVRAADAPFVLLVESQREPELERALLFEAPLRVICCRRSSDVPGCLSLAEAAVQQGCYVAGFLAYEAGYGLQPKLNRFASRAPSEHLVWLGVFERLQELRGRALAAFLAEHGAARSASLSPLRFQLDRAQYRRDFEKIQAHLRAGDSYQVCHSLRARFDLAGPPAALFERLRRRQVTPFSALVDTGEYALVSLSPELFFRKSSGTIELKPMKGTAAPGCDAGEDARIAERMRSDPKTRAENVMIVDLLRNDVGRLAKPGSVRVPELFGVERYDTVLQMTSTIVAEVEPELGLGALLTSLFPSGSVTGAPKLRTMELICELEPEPRGIFCGSLGYVTPNNDACFNVAIRSLFVNRAGQGVLGVGGGVVVDSTSDAEFDECLLKARFLSDAAG
jgi:para-aminobenzoate synthetase/4-amino-4-deoxychorismate lyase